jgi:hypothetical protein
MPLPGSDLAKACFNENIKLFADFQQQPEKFNFYNGLFNLAVAISGIENKLLSIDKRLSSLEQRIR